MTIDGPAGAGKSTVARRVAERLGFRFLDTGAMYRAFTWKALETGVAMDDPSALAAMVRSSDLRLDGSRVVLDGRDISREIREERISRSAFRLADPPEVREELVRLQRTCGRDGGLVTEGRDQGSVVFPDAEVKVYLDAAVEERTRRRLEDLRARGQSVDAGELAESIRRRDEGDLRRPVGALKRPEGAVLLDTTGLTVNEVVERIVRLVPAGS